MRNRHSIRLKDFNYSSGDIYFVTIVAQDRQCIFGQINDGLLTLSPAGLMVEKWIMEMPRKFTGILLDDYIIMPTHVHFIIVHIGSDLCVSPVGEQVYVSPKLSGMVQWFKTMTTNDYIKGIKDDCFLPFNKRLWQRNYHEHIIRDENEWKIKQNYIKNNPSNWNKDENNPQYGPYISEQS